MKEGSCLKSSGVLSLLFITFALFCCQNIYSQNTTQETFAVNIDFSRAASQEQEGFQSYLAEHEDNNSFLPQSYTVGGTTIVIDVEWPEGTKNTAKQMIDRGDLSGNAYSKLLRDWVGTDGRVEKIPLRLRISGLPAGLYQWKSYHHDSQDQTGIFSATVNDANGSKIHSGIDISNGTMSFASVTVFETTIKSDGSDVVLSFKNDSYTGNSTSFFVMNGFELKEEAVEVAPEKVELSQPLNEMNEVSINPKLDWTESYFAKEYKLYLSATNPPELFANTANSDFWVKGLNVNTTYYWCVEAYNEKGSARSDVWSFTTQDSSIFSGDFNFKIDFGRVQSPVQAGFQPYIADHENNSSFLLQEFDVNGLLVAVNTSWQEGTQNTTKQMIDRGGNSGNEYSDLLRDWIGTDGRLEQIPMTLTLKGVPVGKYEWKSYHHDFRDQSGVFSAQIKDAKGMKSYSGISISSGNVDLENASALRAKVIADGSDIEFSFEMDAYPDGSTSLFVLNGFVLEELDSTIVPDQVELKIPLNGLRHVPISPELSWTESFYADEYKVYLSETNPPEYLATAESASFVAPSLASYTTYYWCVEAVNGSGGVKSEVRSFTTENTGTGGFNGEMQLDFSKERMFYDEPFDLNINCNNPHANIIYTLDCSTPSISNGKIYQGEISVDSTMVVKAIALSANAVTEVYTHSYLFPDHIKRQSRQPAGFPVKWGGKRIIDADYEMDPEIIDHPDYEAKIESALKSIPSLSLTMSIDDWFNHSDGLYIGYPNTNVKHEKAVTAEFLFQDKENFALGCGVQNQGGTSIVNWKVPKQSMRLLFKEKYGPSRLRYKLFPDSEIDAINTLVIDGFLYGWVHPNDRKQWRTALFFRDQLAADMHEDMGGLSFHGIYVHLFINGLYWGMYDLHERPDDAFLSEYLDGEREDYEVLKHNPYNVVQGTNEFYLEMLEHAREGLSTEEGLEIIKRYLDVPEFIDYILLNFYLGNYDWAHQNYYVARNKAKNGKFRYYVWDAEHVMRYSNVSYNSTLKNNKGGPTEIHTLLKENEEYRMMFADAVYKHFFNDGALSIENFEKRFLERKNEIDEAVILESARWGDYRIEKWDTTLTRNDHWIPEVNKVLESYIPCRRDTVIEQLRDVRNQLFPDCMPPVFEIKDQNNSQKEVWLTTTNLMKGDIYFTVDGTDPRKKGGGINGIRYVGKIRISSTTEIKARFYSSDDGTWSALAEKTFFFGDVIGENLVINEIMYHPEDENPEFIEIMNNGQSMVDMTGFYLEKGIEYSFNEIVLQPGTGLVLSNDTVLFRSTYEFSALGEYEKQLSNEGETLLLKNNFDQVIDSVTYSDSVPWPEDADGDGYSLELKAGHLDNALAESWKSSTKKLGTPFHPETELELEAFVYPNPFTGKVTVSVKNQSLSYDSLKVEVYSQFGTRVKSMLAESYSSNFEIDLSGVAAGLYFIKIVPLTQTQFSGRVLKAVKM